MYLQIPVLVWEDFETDTQLVFAAKNGGADVKIHNNDLPGGVQYKKVDSIHTDTYRNPDYLYCSTPLISHLMV